MVKPPTLKDVAEAAGVTTTTVARVLKKSGYVADDTRERVLDAVRTTGYRVNSLARSLRRSRSHVIGHLLKATVPNPFFVEVARGVEEHARSCGYTALTYNVQDSSEAERRGIDTFLDWRADALIFSTPVDAANVDYAHACGARLVQVERPRSLVGHRITVRNYDSALRAMRHLTDLGHRAIAFVGVRPASDPGPSGLIGYVERERFQAYQDGMRAVGASTEGLVHFGDHYRLDDATAEGHGHEATRRLMSRGARPSAIIASNDILAAGALQAIHEAGLRVPDQVSVVGFDDTLAGYLTPLLTTVRLPARLLGRKAAELVIDQIEAEGAGEERSLTLDAEFVVRRSTAAPHP